MTPSESPHPRPHFLVVEHPREKKHKCTIAMLKGRPDCTFLWAPDVEDRDWGDALLMHVAGESVLSPDDAGRPLILVDASWRWAERVVKKMDCEKRSLPRFETAYPRSSKLFRDPTGGLASAEALYIAALVFGHRDATLLDGFRWRDEFLSRNRAGLDALEQAALARND